VAKNEGWLGLSGKFSNSRSKGRKTHIRRWIIWNLAVDD